MAWPSNKLVTNACAVRITDNIYFGWNYKTGIREIQTQFFHQTYFHPFLIPDSCVVALLTERILTTINKERRKEEDIWMNFNHDKIRVTHQKRGDPFKLHFE